MVMLVGIGACLSMGAPTGYRKLMHGTAPIAQFQTWLYRMATNACLDETERRSRRPEPVDPLPESPRDEAAPTYYPAARYAIREGWSSRCCTPCSSFPAAARRARLPRRARLERTRDNRGP